MNTSTPVRVTGPLAPYAAGFWQDLARLGYSLPTAEALLYLMAHLSRWLAAAGLGPNDLDPEHVGEYLRYRRASGHVRRLTPRGLIPLVRHLREQGVVVVPPSPSADDAFAPLLTAFERHLADVRGLTPATIDGYRRTARLFLAIRLGAEKPTASALCSLTAPDVASFMLAESRHRRTGALNNIAIGLRAFLRFLFAAGATPTLLADAVLSGPYWRDRGVLRALSPDDVTRLFASCDRRQAAGRRDVAILTVLARLGLRASEVAALTLDDVDWRRGELMVAGKGRRHDRLPLPADVGNALADYCRRGRRRGGCRALFLEVRAPYGRLSPSAVSHVVVRASLRAGLPPATAHRLRHTAAAAMRRAGAPLFEISTVLRHRHGVTTAGYAKDDLTALATVARRWPGGEA